MKPPACCTAYRDLTTQDITNGTWAMFVDLEQVINSQEEESRYAADCASQGRQVGPCGFSGKACKFPLLAARKCLECEVTYHELCAHAANTEGVIKEYKDGCPTCHMHVL